MILVTIGHKQSSHEGIQYTELKSSISKMIHLPEAIKGELNLYNKWQSDDLFHIVINENHPRGNRF